MRIAVLLLMSLMAFLNPSQVFSSTISLPAIVDGTVQFSGAFGLEVFTADPLIRTNSSGPNNNRSGAFEFDLSDLPSDAKIMNATLRLTTAEFISNVPLLEAPLTFQAYEGDGSIQIDDFGTTQERSNGLMVVATETFPAGAVSPQPGAVLNIPLTNLEPLQSAIGNSSYFGIRSMAADFASFQVHSLENGNNARAPQLQVEYVPEPSTGLLLVTGGLSLFGFRRAV